MSCMYKVQLKMGLNYFVGHNTNLRSVFLSDILQYMYLSQIKLAKSPAGLQNIRHNPSVL